MQYISNDLVQPYTYITSHIKGIHISKQNAYGYFVCGGEVDNASRVNMKFVWCIYHYLSAVVYIGQSRDRRHT